MMLDYARERARTVLQDARAVILATIGSSGPTVSKFPCEAVGLDLYLLLPQTSDHLFNIEKDSRIAAITESWELRGQAHALLAEEKIPHLARLDWHEGGWQVLVHVRPIQIHILNQIGWGTAETIDIPQNE